VGLLELPIERVLVSHGEPVLSRGRAALRACVRASRWFSFNIYKNGVWAVAKERKKKRKTNENLDP
jgi:hypothetical protein